jgi:hypothetical protein
LACGLWIGLLYAAAEIVDNGAAQAAIAIGATLALGAFVGRWWVLAVPALLLVVGTIVNAATVGTGYSEDTFGSIEALLIAVFLFAEFLLAMPVAFRTVARRLS